jgi:hypothetical protein
MTLTEENFTSVAKKCYDNIQCYSTKDFEEDMNRFLHIRKLLTKYHTGKPLRERLILNHLIVLYNVFGTKATEFLFFKINQEYWNYLATFLVFMGRLPEDQMCEFKYDQTIIDSLRRI